MPEARRQRAAPGTAAAALGAACLTSFVLANPLSALAQAAPKAGIYRCDINGKTITSDKPIAECTGRDQRMLNADGSVRGILPRTLTAEERAEAEQRQREVDAEEAARKDAVRRDRNLTLRFPDEAKHAEARRKALDDVGSSVRNSERRVVDLKLKRKPLLDEAEFFVGKPLPPKLKLELDANDAALEAQNALIANQQTEVNRINALYNIELARLRKLWAGVPPGSLGPAPAAVAASATAARVPPR